MYFEPQYFPALRFLTKVTAMLTVMDDIYDAYGTFEELEHLTEAVKRSIGFLHIDLISILLGVVTKLPHRELIRIDNISIGMKPLG